MGYIFPVDCSFLLYTVHDRACVHTEAVSDSEVTDHGSISEAGSDRGYTSDSELYECHARQQNNHHHLSTPDLAIVPVSENGSWMLVSDDVV